MAAEQNNVIPLKLHCSAGNTGLQTVSFGVPFPRGVLADPRMVRIETPSGVEIPSGAVELARWRHLVDKRMDGNSIRSLLISFNHLCLGEGQELYQVHWGVLRDRSGFVAVTPADVTSGWGGQARPLSAEHPATDNYQIDTSAPPILEAKVWVTLPSAWLMKQDLHGPSAAIYDRQIHEYMLGYARTAVNDTSPEVLAFEQQDNRRGLIDWRVEVEGWLYDRPQALWNVYIQTGDVKWLRHAHRASQYYASWIAIDDSRPPYKRGAFRKKPVSSWRDRGDPKYSVSGGLLTAYLLTGDARLLDRIVAIADFVGEQISTRLPTASSRHVLWSERLVAISLADALYAFEATGAERYRKRAIDIVNGIVEDIATPPPRYPPDMSGILLHTWMVHEGVDKSGWIMSPWMSALLVEALGNYYALSGDTRALEAIYNYAKFVSENGLVEQTCTENAGPSLAPRYLASKDSSSAQLDAPREHAYDVFAMLHRGIWGGTQLGLATELMRKQVGGLRACALASFADGKINTDGNRATYNIAPTRKFNWWFGSTSSTDWFISNAPP